MLKVSSTSEPSATAGALANTIREDGHAELQAIGPKAVNQAIKSITIARGYMAPSGTDLVFVPAFVDVKISGEKKTAIRLLVDTRLPYTPSKSQDSKRREESEESPEIEPSKEERGIEESQREEEREDEQEKDILDF